MTSRFQENNIPITDSRLPTSDKNFLHIRIARPITTHAHWLLENLLAMEQVWKPLSLRQNFLTLSQNQPMEYYLLKKPELVLSWDYTKLKTQWYTWTKLRRLTFWTAAVKANMMEGRVSKAPALFGERNTSNVYSSLRQAPSNPKGSVTGHIYPIRCSICCQLFILGKVNWWNTSISRVNIRVENFHPVYVNLLFISLPVFSKSKVGLSSGHLAKGFTHIFTAQTAIMILVISI